MLIRSLGRALKDERWGEGPRKLPEAAFSRISLSFGAREYGPPLPQWQCP